MIDAIENLAVELLEKSGQIKPPYLPSIVLKEVFGVRTVYAVKPGGYASEAITIPGEDPRCEIAKAIGADRGRYLVSHELGHVAQGHINPHGLFEIPVASFGARGNKYGSLPVDKEREAVAFALAFTMPRRDIDELFADKTRSLVEVVQLFQVPETEVKKRLRDTDRWRLTWDDRGVGRVAYSKCGWWAVTRRPAYFSGASQRQGRPDPLCEERSCRRKMTTVHHLHYETPGCESDEDLEGLCQEHAYEKHVEAGRL